MVVLSGLVLLEKYIETGMQGSVRLVVVGQHASAARKCCQSDRRRDVTHSLVMVLDSSAAAGNDS